VLERARDRRGGDAPNPTGPPSATSHRTRLHETRALCNDLGVSENFVIDIWSDVVCPFCYLGSRQLAQALERFDHREEVVLRRRAFELDPNAQLAYERPLAELVAAKYDIPVAQVHTMHDRLLASAQALGLTWSLETAQPTNTFDAHRVIALASSHGLGDEMSERLFRAYFSEGELLSDHGTLSDLAREVGVLGVEVLWESDDFADVVRADEAAAHELNITGVPSFLMDAKFMVSGAQGTEQILDALQRAWARRAA
jgi:predicted DsbA family dithiol-disulfide isomerase